MRSTTTCWALTCTVAVRTEVARIGHRATRDVRRIRKAQALRRALNSDLAGVEDARSQTPFRSDVRRHYARDLPGSGASRPQLRVLRRGTCQLCARSKRRSGSPSATRREAESGKCGSDKVQGRHPCLVTRAAVFGVGEGVPPTATLHAHKSREKSVWRQTYERWHLSGVLF